MKNDKTRNGEASKLDELTSRFHGIRRSRNGFTARCPAHDDRRNSLSVGQAPDGRVLIKCHAGCQTPDILKAAGLSFRDLFPSADGSALQSRKLPQTVRSLPPPGGSSVPRSRKTPSSTVAVYRYEDENGELLFEVVRTDPKGFYQRRPTADGSYETGLGSVRRVLYALPRIVAAVRSGQMIVLCEGEKDADALNALGLFATTAPMGAGKWRPEYAAVLSGASVVICPDNDPAGENHLRVCAESLLSANCAVRVARVSSLFPALAAQKGADVGDYLALSPSPAEAAALLLSQAVPYPVAPFDGLDAYLLDGFPREIGLSRRVPAVPTGFSSLDAQLGGGLYPGLYVLGSVSSLGKTALLAQIALHVAAQGRKALFFSLEMSRAEMTARAVLRLLFERDPVRFGKITLNEILSGQTPSEISAEINSLAALPALQNLSVVEGDFTLSADDIRTLSLQTQKTYGHPPVLFVDYLQIMSSTSSRLGERSAVDENVLALKRLSRLLNAPVLAVSSFNRQNYAASASFAAFKESGAIEYSADVVLALQASGLAALSAPPASSFPSPSSLSADPARIAERATLEAKRRDPRPLELITLKNRRGPAFARAPLTFYASRYYFAEGE